MRNLRKIKKTVIALVVLVIAATSATLMSFGSNETSQAMKRWGYNPSAPAGSQWTDLTGLTEQTPVEPGQYSCTSSNQICSAEFPENVNPNSLSTPTPSNIIRGDFELIEN